MRQKCLVETGVGDNYIPHLGEKTEEVVVGQCQDQHQNLGLDQVLG